MRNADDPARELATGQARLSSYGALLRNRNYRLWFVSSLGASLGDWAGLFALQVLVVSLAEPGSRLALFGLGGIMMARLLPSVMFGPVAGVLADRYDRRRLMVVTDLARGGLFVGIAFSRDLVTLFTLTFVIECLSLLFIAAKDSALPALVQRRHLTQANQLNLLVTYGPLPFGAVVASAMVALAGYLAAMGLPTIQPTMLALLVNAAAFIIAGLIISRIALPARERVSRVDDSHGVISEMREGLRFIRDLPLIRSLIMGVVGIFFGAGVVVTLGPEFVRTELGRPQTDWFGLMTMVGAGLLAGITVVAYLTSKIRKERLLPVCMSAAGAIAVVTATLPSFRQTMVAGFLLGALAGVSIVVGYTLLHEYTEDDVRARTFAAFYTGTRIAMFTALGLAPFLAGAIGTGTLIAGGRVFTMSGIRLVMLLGGLVAFASAVLSGRGMARALREQADGQAGHRPVRLHPGGEPDAAGKGLFIAFEGVEGSGKSTQVQALASTLRAEGHDVLVTREPGGPPVAERIRALLLDPNAGGMLPRTEALLYAAARAEHVYQVILPALEAGKIVICDRFVDSSLAYQGFARELGPTDVLEINRWAIAGLLPDAVVLLYLDPEEGMRRVTERAKRRDERPGDRARTAWHDRGTDRMEREDLSFHQRVADGYLTLAKRQRSRFVLVDASADPETVTRQVRSGLHAWIALPPAARGATGDDSDAGQGRDAPGAAG